MSVDREKEQAELNALYVEIAELTKPKCGQCRVPYQCCQPDVCELIALCAKEDGIDLPRTDHPTLPFMGPEGCTLEPFQRPLCAVHVCENHLWEPVFYEEYMVLRARITEKEYDLHGG